MNTKLANPKALGYTALFINIWLISIINAGWVSTDPKLAASAGMILGLTIILAGIFAYFKEYSFEMTLFIVFGALFFTYSLSNTLGGITLSRHMGYDGWMEILWSVFFFFMWLIGKNRGIWINLFLLGSWLIGLLFAISDWTNFKFLIILGGYIGLVTAILACLLAYNELIDMIQESKT